MKSSYVHVNHAMSNAKALCFAKSQEPHSSCFYLNILACLIALIFSFLSANVRAQNNEHFYNVFLARVEQVRINVTVTLDGALDESSTQQMLVDVKQYLSDRGIAIVNGETTSDSALKLLSIDLSIALSNVKSRVYNEPMAYYTFGIRFDSYVAAPLSINTTNPQIVTTLAYSSSSYGLAPNDLLRETVYESCEKRLSDFIVDLQNAKLQHAANDRD